MQEKKITALLKRKSLFLSWIFSIGLSIWSYGQIPGYSPISAFDLNPDSQYDSLVYPIPEIVYCNKPSDGHIFTVVKTGKYLYTADNEGSVIFYQKVSSKAYNFQAHKSGLLSYFDYSLKGFITMDKFYNVLDTFQMQNGFVADMHEFVLEDNGDAWMLAYDSKLMDMSEVVEGGNPEATVIGLVIQKIDRNDNVLFEWQSWDHFSINDSHAILTASVVDYVHGNSIDVDSDTSIIISSRNLNEITKININTGEIIWRMGGKNNQFTFINDDRGFAGQHSAKKQKNGNLTLYDNGLDLVPKYSRGLEYELDEENLTVTLVQAYTHDPLKYARVVGNMQKLENENSFIYWGSVLNEKNATISEYNSAGDLEFEALFKNRFTPDYRVYRSNWKSGVFTIEPDSLNFTQNHIDQSVEKGILVTNNSEEAISINALYNRNGSFKLLDNLPVQIQPGANHQFNVAFHSDKLGVFKDILNFGIETDTSLISAQLFVSGAFDYTPGNEDHAIDLIKLYPNPFSDYIRVSSEKEIFTLKLYNTNGKLLIHQNGPGREITISTQMLESGLYILVASGGEISTYRKLIFKY